MCNTDRWENEADLVPEMEIIRSSTIHALTSMRFIALDTISASRISSSRLLVGVIPYLSLDMLRSSSQRSVPTKRYIGCDSVRLSAKTSHFDTRLTTVEPPIEWDSACDETLVSSCANFDSTWAYSKVTAPDGCRGERKGLAESRKARAARKN